jgi:phosphohistidine phosphatase
MMGHHLRERTLPKPDLALCSTARRAVDTLGICLGAWGIPLRTNKLKSLYLCGADGLLRRIQATPDSVNTVMLVAHNPDMHDIAVRLANSGRASKLDALRKKFPTGCFTRFSFDVESWKNVSADSGTLLTFLQPQDLD